MPGTNVLIISYSPCWWIHLFSTIVWDGWIYDAWHLTGELYSSLLATLMVWVGDSRLHTMLSHTKREERVVGDTLCTNRSVGYPVIPAWVCNWIIGTTPWVGSKLKLIGLRTRWSEANLVSGLSCQMRSLPLGYGVRIYIYWEWRECMVRPLWSYEAQRCEGNTWNSRPWNKTTHSIMTKSMCSLRLAAF